MMLDFRPVTGDTRGGFQRGGGTDFSYLPHMSYSP
jgi:hypothetical protein